MVPLPQGIQRDYVAGAAAEELEVGVIGSGSNLLVADAGVRGPVLKLDQGLTDIDVDGTRISCRWGRS